MNTFAVVLSGVACVLAIGSLVFVWRLHSRMQSSLGSLSDPESLASQLGGYRSQVSDAQVRLHELNELYTKLDIRSSVASQKISIVRFNPFGDTGGDQSFSLAVLDAHDSGYVLTSIHGRQGTRMYIKPLDFGKSRYGLSDEEKLAITQAMQRLPASESPQASTKEEA